MPHHPHPGCASFTFSPHVDPGHTVREAAPALTCSSRLCPVAVECFAEPIANRRSQVTRASSTGGLSRRRRRLPPGFQQRSRARAHSSTWMPQQLMWPRARPPDATSRPGAVRARACGKRDALLCVDKDLLIVGAPHPPRARSLCAAETGVCSAGMLCGAARQGSTVSPAVSTACIRRPQVRTRVPEHAAW